MSSVTTDLRKPPGLSDAADSAARRLGVSVDRVRTSPPPGEATDADWLAEVDGESLCELVDGTLVEKTLGADEASLAGHLITLFELANEQLRQLTNAADPPYRLMGPDGPVRAGGNGRQPDVSVLAGGEWSPSRDNPRVAEAPLLAVEVVSESNTRREMLLRRQDDFAGGVREVWVADYEALTVESWTDPTNPVVYGVGNAVPADVVFPGLRVPVEDWLRGRLVRRAVELAATARPHS